MFDVVDTPKTSNGVQSTNRGSQRELQPPVAGTVGFCEKGIAAILTVCRLDPEIDFANPWQAVT